MFNFNEMGVKYRDSVMARMTNNFIIMSYYNTLELLAMAKFDYKNLPQNIENEFIEKAMIRGGVVAMTPIIDSYDNVEKMFCGIPVLSGVTMYPNISRQAQLTTPCGSSEVLLIGKDIPVGYNNYNHTPEFDILRYSELFAEIDKSIDIAIKNTRMTKVFPVSDSKQADTINEVMNDIYNGKPKAIALKKTFEDTLNESMGDREKNFSVPLTDPRDVETIQYLSKLHDDLVRRIATLHGHKMNTTGKMAQMTRDELNESETFSHIYVCQQMEMRKRFVDDCNRILGTNIEVEYGCAWKHFEKGEISEDEFIEEVVEDGGNNE